MAKYTYTVKEREPEEAQKIEMDMYGAILGKALYTGSIDLKEAIQIAKGVTL